MSDTDLEGHHMIGDAPTPPSKHEWTIDHVLRPHGAVVTLRGGIFISACGSGEHTFYYGDGDDSTNWILVENTGKCPVSVKVYSLTVNADGSTKTVETPAKGEPPARVAPGSSGPLIKRKRVTKATVTCEGGAADGSCKVQWTVWG